MIYRGGEFEVEVPDVDLAPAIADRGLTLESQASPPRIRA
jgi:hypothetical protein